MVERQIMPPLPTAHFRVLIDREEIGLLSVSPLQCLHEDAADSELRQTVILCRAASTDRRLFDWYHKSAKCKDDATDLTVVQLACADGTPVNVWCLRQATPVRWTGPGFDALSNAMAMEELEVRYESITWQDKL